MRTPILFLLTLLSSIGIWGQDTKSLGLEIVGRYDQHADYATRYSSRSYTNDLKLSGKSWGANLQFRDLVSRHFGYKAAIGYYRLGVDKINMQGRIGGVVTSRPIDYPHPLGIQPLFSTDKYHYNNLNLSAGLVYQQKLFRNLDYSAEVDFNYMYTFSQTYSINYNSEKFRPSNGKTLGYGINAGIGAIKKIGSSKYYLYPKLIIPIYQRLNTDEVFREDESTRIDKWFNGIGLSIAVMKYL